MNFDLSDQI